MIRITLKVRDKNKVNELERYGSIIYTSPVLNIVAMEILKENFDAVRTDENVLWLDIETKGSFLNEGYALCTL